MEKDINELINALIPESTKLMMDAFTQHMEHQEYTLVQLFDHFNTEVMKVMKDHGKVCGITAFMFRDNVDKKWKAGLYPMPNLFPGAMDLHGKLVRDLVKKMKETPVAGFTLTGVYRMTDCHMSFANRKDCLDVNGDVDMDKFVRPSEDPKAKDVLQFEMEDAFVKHTKSYEYVRVNDDVIFNDKPIHTSKSAYNPIEDKNSTFGYVFTEGTQLN